MGDQHVCSFCGAQQAGKQHIKLVFENWPVEELVSYTRKGVTRQRRRKRTKEVISAIGMECLSDPERWEDYGLEPDEVTDFFERLRLQGKNPIFQGVLVADGSLQCVTKDCPQRLPIGEFESSCTHVTRGPYPGVGLDALSCWAGHPGVVLVRGRPEEVGKTKSMTVVATALRLVRYVFWPPGAPMATRAWYGLLWGVPLLFLLVGAIAVAPFWGAYAWRHRSSLQKIPLPKI